MDEGTMLELSSLETSVELEEGAVDNAGLELSRLDEGSTISLARRKVPSNSSKSSYKRMQQKKNKIIKKEERQQSTWQVKSPALQERHNEERIQGVTSNIREISGIHTAGFASTRCPQARATVSCSEVMDGFVDALPAACLLSSPSSIEEKEAEEEEPREAK